MNGSSGFSDATQWTLVLLASLSAAACSRKPDPRCQGSTAVLVNGKPTGYEECLDGRRHRVKATPCPPPTMDRFLRAGECRISPTGQYCGCDADADCTDSQICVCGESGGMCVHSECEQDANCPHGLCVSYSGACQGGYRCQQPGDECVTDADCDGRGYYCGHDGKCGAAVCGRPFLINEQARLAGVVRSDAWGTERHAIALRGLSRDLSEAERMILAEHWSLLGRMEHASIAAFARFVMQILSQGAPAWLVRDAQRAMADETAHAEGCFAIASAYHGQPLGPGSLSMQDALGALDAVSIARAVIREGCVGESCAALEAEVAHERATAPPVRKLLARIVRDERAHAELSWAYLVWAMESGLISPEAVHHEFQLAMREAAADVTQPVELPIALSEHGFLTVTERERARLRALDLIVRPGVNALLRGRFAVQVAAERATARDGQSGRPGLQRCCHPGRS